MNTTTYASIHLSSQPASQPAPISPLTYIPNLSFPHSRVLFPSPHAIQIRAINSLSCTPSTTLMRLELSQ
ncbi:hypothetical protein E2C01_051742 [Portunus trituberculatus]|uniref:Uncharacterized protein n=1 Tax=Portunus trituberculatus TaxID=210409 RepID=A0A5B7GK58_PORTR|nr:hypothetical protein [Portunus trituberculatus]